MANAGKIDPIVVGMNLEEYIRAMEASFFGGLERQRMPMAMFSWSSPGMGKTAAVNELKLRIERRLEVVCSECGKTFQQGPANTCPACDHVQAERVVCELYALSTSALEPVDVTGVPGNVLDEKNIAIFSRYLPMEWAWRISKQYEEHEREARGDPDWCAPPAILFFDDMTAAHFQTQTAFYKGLHEGIWGCYDQRDNVITVGAGNWMSDNAGATEMPTATGNRLRHVYLKECVQTWLAWARGFREADEPGVKGEARIHPRVSAYIAMCEDALYGFTPEVATRVERAWASPRSFHNLSEIIYEAQFPMVGIEDATKIKAHQKGKKKEDRFFAKMAMGTIGIAEATGFLAFILHSDALIPPMEIVADPLAARCPSAENPDAMYATITSLEQHVRQNVQHWEAALIYGMRDEVQKDIGIMLFQTIIKVVNLFEAESRAEAMGSEIFEKGLDTFQDLLGCLDFDYPGTT